MTLNVQHISKGHSQIPSQTSATVLRFIIQHEHFFFIFRTNSNTRRRRNRSKTEQKGRLLIMYIPWAIILTSQEFEFLLLFHSTKTLKQNRARKLTLHFDGSQFPSRQERPFPKGKLLHLSVARLSLQYNALRLIGQDDNNALTWSGPRGVVGCTLASQQIHPNRLLPAVTIGHFRHTKVITLMSLNLFEHCPHKYLDTSAPKRYEPSSLSWFHDEERARRRNS
jgi:hypothetical protein